MCASKFIAKTNTTADSLHDITGFGMPAVAFNYVVIEQPGKDGFLVRKGFLATPENYLKLQKLGLTEAQIHSEFYPEKFGLIPKGWGKSVTPIEHVMGNNVSPFISTSSLFPNGAGDFLGKKIYFDIEKLNKAGIKIISTEEIAKSLTEYKVAHPHTAPRIDKLIKAITEHEGEVLLHGEKIPAAAIFTPRSLAATTVSVRVVKVVGVIGIVFTAYELEQATEKSIKVKSVKPISAEVIRQAGGWAGARAGFAIGGEIGALAGIETGPGAVVTGLVGGIIFGVGGYYGASWAADHIDKK
ncbi:glycine zipper family protein [Paraherbaspirillum soli]|uniref:Glycine zipper family protein n=1 Tax=Paraherbaspirillum soli TaxID=631222 RepID=A0ABW0MCL0_9BURK